MTDHALYRFYSKTGQLLYVGITNNPGNRFGQHQADKPWWHEVAGISMERYDTREDVLAAEVRAIEVERPLHNRKRPTLRKKSRPTTAPQRTLVWQCHGCQQPIADGKGYIHVSVHDYVKHQEQYQALKDKVRSESRNGWEMWGGDNMAALLDLEPAKWQAHHRDCDPDIDADSYWFDVERARSHGRLLDWTLHLMNKNWIHSTDWTEFIYSKAQVPFA